MLQEPTYLPNTFLFSHLLPEFRISEIHVLDYVDFLRQVKQAKANISLKKRTDDDSFEMYYQDNNELTLF